MKYLSLIWLPCLLLLSTTACTDLSVTGYTEEPENAGINETDAVIPACSSNNSSEDCQITISKVTVEFTGEACAMYDHMIRVRTDFAAPAGLGTSPTSRIDWEFLPKGNAGFWISPIKSSGHIHQGTLEDLGCFSFGEQDTLRIYHQITDTEGKSSNIIYTDIPAPRSKSSGSGSTNPAAFKKGGAVRY